MSTCAVRMPCSVVRGRPPEQVDCRTGKRAASESHVAFGSPSFMGSGWLEIVFDSCGDAVVQPGVEGGAGYFHIIASAVDLGVDESQVKKIQRDAEKIDRLELHGTQPGVQTEGERNFGGRLAARTVLAYDRASAESQIDAGSPVQLVANEGDVVARSDIEHRDVSGGEEVGSVGSRPVRVPLHLVAESGGQFQIVNHEVAELGTEPEHGAGGCLGGSGVSVQGYGGACAASVYSDNSAYRHVAPVLGRGGQASCRKCCDVRQEIVNFSIMKAKTILITGATSGIGEACARRFAGEGRRLILNGRNTEKLDTLRRELVALGSEVQTLPFDVRDREAMSRAMASLPEGWDNIDVLVNNAGLSLGDDKEYEGSLEEWDTVIDTNIKALLAMTRMVVPGMVERGHGHIVNIGSIAGDTPYGGGGVYCASKAAVKALSDSLRIDLVDTPLRVTNVKPGKVETHFSVTRYHGDQAKADAVYEGFQPLRGEDVAEVVYFAVSAPDHVQIAEVLVMPTAQATSTLCARKK